MAVETTRDRDALLADITLKDAIAQIKQAREEKG